MKSTPSLISDKPFQALTSQSLFMKALRQETVSRPPVWMMRQAGRYLPDYMKLKAKYSFFERVENPELATEITVMPVDQVGVDAAIIFSDILVIPQALDFEVTMKTGQGPRLPVTIQSAEQIDQIVVGDMADRLHYVLDALALTRQTLAGRVPLIGFAGSPWTLFCYMVEGKGTKNFAKAKAFAFQHPEATARLLQKLSDATIQYLQAQIVAGADAVQVFDSWGGLLSPQDFQLYSFPYLKQIANAIEDAPVILYAKGCSYALADLANTNAAALGIDWQTNPQFARSAAGANISLQGNFDPSRLLSPISEIERLAKEMIQGFGPQNYIANLGHGILPNIPVDHAKAFVNTIKSWA
ncbi:MAG: uroporphyrinogen decarboxylase [Bacteroidota bacterium]